MSIVVDKTAKASHLYRMGGSAGILNSLHFLVIMRQTSFRNLEFKIYLLRNAEEAFIFVQSKHTIAKKLQGEDKASIMVGLSFSKKK